MNRYVLLLSALCLPMLAQGAMFKCEKPNKTVVYSDKPCPTGSQAKALGASVTPAKVSSEPALGEEWRGPYFSESKNDTDWRSESKDAYYKAKADFDGDGMEDAAYLLISRNNNESAVVVYLSSQKFRPIPVVKEIGLYAVTGRGLKTLAGEVAGDYKVSCTLMGCLQKLPKDTPFSNPSLKIPAVAYFASKDAQNPQLFVWDADEKRFYALQK